MQVLLRGFLLFLAGLITGVVALLAFLYRLKAKHTLSAPASTTAATARLDALREHAFVGYNHGRTKEALSPAEARLAYANSLLMASNVYTVCDLGPDRVAQICGYAPADEALNALHLFETIKMETHCAFSKRSRLWACCDDFEVPEALKPPRRTPTASTDPVHEKKSEHSAISEGNETAGDHHHTWAKSIRAFALFASVCHDVDGFLFTLPPTDDLMEHGDAVYRFLYALSACDETARINCLDPAAKVESKRWKYTFGGNAFFVTSFSPCYPPSSSRYQFGVTEASFVFFQPFSSFLLHGVGTDTPKSQTQWDAPKSMRDITRCQFYKHGRPYFVSEVPALSPIIHHVVLPAQPEGHIVRWWDAGKPSHTIATTMEAMEAAVIAELVGTTDVAGVHLQQQQPSSRKDGTNAHSFFSPADSSSNHGDDPLLLANKKQS